MVATPTRENELYSDFLDNLDRHPITKDLLRVSNEDSVKQSIKNLMLTSPYERVMKPELGSGLPGYLFENTSPFTQFQMEENIRQVITNYEPRAEIIDITINILPDQNRFDVKLIFRVISSNKIVEINTILERTR